MANTKIDQCYFFPARFCKMANRLISKIVDV